MINFRNSSALVKAILVLIVLFAVVLSALLAFRLVSGRSLGLRSFARDQVYAVTSRGKALSDSSSIKATSTGDYTNIIFLHHSVGHNLIDQGQVRELFTQSGYDFYDHDYNHLGLRNPDGEYLDYGYNVPHDNTDPDGLAEIFSQPVYTLPLNTFSGLLQHEVIVFKSCFPVSDITSKEKLDEYKVYYLEIREVMDQHPEKIFILVTPPPLNSAETNSGIAARARRFTDWLVSDEYLAGRLNVFTFNFFDHLAEDDPTSPELNMLRAEYRQGSDSHPSLEANQTIGPRFVDFVIQAVNEYK
jgi:hypothetical protein